MSNEIGLFDFPAIRRGDTFRGRNIAKLSQATVAVPITKAVLEVRSKPNKDLVHRWASDDDPATLTITGTDLNIATLQPVLEAVTATWPVGKHQYDLAVWFTADGAKKSILTGIFPVTESNLDLTPEP